MNDNLSQSYSDNKFYFIEEYYFNSIPDSETSPVINNEHN